MIISPLSLVFNHRYFQHAGPGWNWSHRPRPHEYIIPSSVQWNDSIVFSYKDSLTAGVATVADCKAAKVVKTYRQDGNDVESEEDEDVPDMGSYFISSEIPVE